MWWKSSFTHNNVVIYISSLSDYTSTIAMYYKGFCSYNNKHLWLNKIRREDDFFTIFRGTPNTHQAKKVKWTIKCYGISSLRNLKKEIISTLHNCFTKGQCYLYSTSEKRRKNNNKIIAFYSYNCFCRSNTYINNSFIQLSTKCVSIYLSSSCLPIL